MKHIHFAKYIVLSLITLSFFTSCKKDVVEPLGDNGQKTIGFATYGGRNAAAFNAATLALDLTKPKDSVEVRLLYSTPQVSDKDITVTVCYDAAKLTSFNASQPAGGIIYTALTSSQYMLKTTQVKIRANQSLSEPFFIIFYNNQLDASKSYMLPLGICKIEGAPSDVKAATGTGTAYFHIIGNPLAGTYDLVALRYNYIGTASFDGNPANIPTPFSTTAIPTPKSATPIDQDKVDMDFSNLGSQTSFNFRYIITQVNNFASISVGYNTEFTTGNSSIRTYVSQYVAPSATQKAKFRIITHYNNAAAGGGNDRIIDEIFTQR